MHYDRPIVASNTFHLKSLLTNLHGFDRTGDRREILRLSPGFIRARYNLGINCLNLNAYKQAIEQFSITLQQQKNGICTENIWRTLSIVIDRLKRSDLEQYVVLREFQIE